jgi:CheY-like chemotaxis protein
MMLKDLRVLFVDDDLRVREVVWEVLQYAGACVALAASAAEAMEAIDTFKPHVIVCDITMPVEDGYSFIRRLRSREAKGGLRPARIPAMALTAHATVNDRRRALAAGFQQYVTKPIDVDRLRVAVLEVSRIAV